MTTRAALIEELADDVADGEDRGGFSAEFFLDALMDSGRVTANDLFILLFTLRHRYTSSLTADRILLMVRKDALEFFTTDQRGIDYISDQLATRTASESDDLREVDLAGRIREMK